METRGNTTLTTEGRVFRTVPETEYVEYITFLVAPGAFYFELLFYFLFCVFSPLVLWIVCLVLIQLQKHYMTGVMAYCYGLIAARVCNYVPELIISTDTYQALDELNQLCWCNGKKKLAVI